MPPATVQTKPRTAASPVVSDAPVTIPLGLTAVAMIPESQLWTLQEPDRSRIARGLEWAAGNKPTETDIDDLLKPRAKRASGTRGRRR
jgi:hypothetical protein